MSFQFSTMYYITGGSSIYLLHHQKKVLFQQNSIYFFTLIGILTAYFDFLTYPLVSYGIPMILYLLLLNQLNQLSKKSICIYKIMANGIGWSIGYGGMYIGKWLISWILTGYNTWADATMEAANRMSMQKIDSGTITNIPLWKVITNNFNVILHDPIFVILMIILITSIVSIYKSSLEASSYQHTYLQFALAIISVTPFIWYIVLSNHSYIHCWFTYRELSIFIFAIGCILATKLEAIYNLKSKD